MKIETAIKMALVWACTFFFLLPAAYAEHSVYVFQDKSLTIERKYGASIDVQKIEFVGTSRIHYTTPDGEDGYLGEANVKNLQDLYLRTGRTVNSPRKPQEIEPVISTREYTEKIYKLDRELKEERQRKASIGKQFKHPSHKLSGQEEAVLFTEQIGQIKQLIEECIENFGSSECQENSLMSDMFSTAMKRYIIQDKQQSESALIEK